MEVPKYIKEMMKRSRFYYDFDSVDNPSLCAVGYTILIPKVSIYSKVYTLKEEVERLKNWVERQSGGTCHIVSVPEKTKYDIQYAIVTILDPVMNHLQKYIG